MKNLLFVSKVLGYAIPLTFIVAYFSFDIPVKTLLTTLMYKFLFMAPASVLMVVFQKWALKSIKNNP
ncbi:hypothetical protein [Haliscomenobacter sp.]|uniref:hypothetical protein n=1 Tax=Haliscomenobacter sp. TaxID=2717303 RepID=UPI0035938F9B